MPYLHGRHDGRQAIIQVAIIDAAKHLEHKQSSNQILRGVRPFRALIDTGATVTMITSRVIQEAGLQPVNRRKWASADGERWLPAYLFHVAFYGELVSVGDSEEDGTSQVHKILICKTVINGGEIKDESSFDVLLGMDILSTGILTVKNDGSYSFEF
jgi:hypothetical protein